MNTHSGPVCVHWSWAALAGNVLLPDSDLKRLTPRFSFDSRASQRVTGLLPVISPPALHDHFEMVIWEHPK